MDSLAEKLSRRGFLTLSEFVEYLQLYYPEMAIAYQTAAKMVKRGELRVIKVSKTNRVMHSEIRRYLQQGNFEGGEQPPSSHLSISAPEARPLDVSKLTLDSLKGLKR